MKCKLTCSCAQGSADRGGRVELLAQNLTYAKLAAPANHITMNLQAKMNTPTLQDEK